MSETKFTKGDWKISTDGLSVGVNGFKVARDFSGGATPYVMQTINNAHLIKTAPKMYGALQSILDSPYTELQEEDFEMIEKVLAEARGEL